MRTRTNLKQNYRRQKRIKRTIPVVLVLFLLAGVISAKVLLTHKGSDEASTADYVVNKETVQAATAGAANDQPEHREEVVKQEVPRSEVATEPVKMKNETETEVQQQELPDPDLYEGTFELPIAGTSGWASIQMSLYSEPNIYGGIVENLAPGTNFVILDEVDRFFQVRTTEGTEGYVISESVLVNLPDIIPSVIYTDTNSEQSLFRSSGVEIPGITGQQLYSVYNWNERLQREQYDMPVLYGTTLKVMAAQKAALEKGYSLRIYETYRPKDVQFQIRDAFQQLVDANPTVKGGLKLDTWSIGWFIATKVSNHQRGIGLDMTLVKVDKTAKRYVGDYSYLTVTEYTELEMPTEMHELSASGIRYTSPYTTFFSQQMNDNAILLHQICVDSGLSPLASEWWHFNDVATQNSVAILGDGSFRLSANCSVQP